MTGPFHAAHSIFNPTNVRAELTWGSRPYSVNLTEIQLPTTLSQAFFSLCKIAMHRGRRFFDPTPEEEIIVLIDGFVLLAAERLIESCEQCNVDAEVPFDWILDRLTGRDSAVTDYILEHPAECPNCGREIFEKTLVEPS